MILTDSCLCLSGIPTFLKTNVIAIVAVELAGEQVVTNILTNLVCCAESAPLP